MQKHTLKRGVVLMVAVVAWVGWGTPQALAQRARVPQTGQTTSYAPGDDGAIQAGVAWPIPRFTNRGDGTVRDNLTGLIWLRVANCFGALQWPQALTVANMLADGQCGLTDKSEPGDWRLPNVRELHSLLDFGFILPALSNAAGMGQWAESDAFSGVQSADYWSSATDASASETAWYVPLADGSTDRGSKEGARLVWPVRGGD